MACSAPESPWHNGKFLPAPSELQTTNAARLVQLPISLTTHLPRATSVQALAHSLRFSPLTTIMTRDRATLIRHLGALIQEWQISLVVIGALPSRNLNTSDCHPSRPVRKITQIAHKLARQLHSQFHLRTVLAGRIINLNDCRSGE